MSIQNITTPRTTLQPVQQEDASFIFEANTGTVKKYFIPFDSLGDVEEWIQENIGKMEREEKMEMVIVDNSTQEKVGMVALDSLHSDTIVPRLWIAEKFQRQGYAQECLETFISSMREDKRHQDKPVVYEVDLDNEPSINLVKKLGFEMDHLEKDEDGDYYVYIKK